MAQSLVPSSVLFTHTKHRLKRRFNALESQSEMQCESGRMWRRKLYFLRAT